MLGTELVALILLGVGDKMPFLLRPFCKPGTHSVALPILATTKTKTLKEEPVVRSDCKHNLLSMKAQHHGLRPSAVAAFKKLITTSQHFSRL